MAPQTGTALLIVVLFVLPGFVALLIGDRTHVLPRRRSRSELPLQAITYSVVCWVLIGLASWPFGLGRADLRRMYREESLGELALLGLFAVLVFPAILATVARLWRQSETVRPWLLRRLRINRAHSVPTAWDELFSRATRRRPRMLVKAVLSDGRIVGGLFGVESFAGYGEQSQDLLLDELWTIGDDGGFVGPAPDSHGVWLSAGSIVSLELYDPPAAQEARAGLDIRAAA